MGQFCCGQNTSQWKPLELECLDPLINEKSIRLARIRDMLTTDSVKLQLNERAKSSMFSCPQKIHDRHGISTFALELHFMSNEWTDDDLCELEMDDGFVAELINKTELSRFSYVDISIQSNSDCELHINVACHCQCFVGKLSI